MHDTYWNDNGKHEELHKKIMEHEDRVGVSGWKEFAKPENGVYALMNGMRGIYYEHYNNGGDVCGAFENNKVHGFDNRFDFVSMLYRIEAPSCISAYVYGEDVEDSEDEEENERRLEEALDATILFVAEKLGIADEKAAPPIKKRRKAK